MMLLCTLVLQVKRGQGGADESGYQSAAPAVLEVLLHPVKQPVVGVTWACGLVEVNDAGTENIQNQHKQHNTSLT